MFSQNQGVVKGRILDAETREPVPFANAAIMGTTIGAVSDFDGNFEINNVPLGYVKVEVSFVGYKAKVTEDVLVTKGKTPFVAIELFAASEQLEEVVIKAELFEKRDDAPVSMQTIGISEIEKNPGGNRDISKVIQSLPGVAANPGFRNDIVIRGGAPGENRFYLDGIEVPVINHFQTQGASGGPVGIINVNLIREVDFYSGAFPANTGNALSAVLDFKQIEGNKDKLHTRFTVGSSDVGLTLDGPLGKNTSYIFSIRQSYLQFLFTALQLPFLPTFNDVQYKVKHRINDKNYISFVGLGALDRFKLNEGVNDNVTDLERLKFNEYLLSNLPIQEQWNYTAGVVYDRYTDDGGKHRLVLSRNEWNNSFKKYKDNDESSDNNLLSKYESVETENKLRYEHKSGIKKFDLKSGFGLQDVLYTNSTYARFYTPFGEGTVDYTSKLRFLKYEGFSTIGKRFLQSKLGLSLGLRVDGNTYSANMLNPLNQFSPRVSGSYSITDKLSLNANIGRYFQLPAYTIMGYRDENGTLLNKENGIKYLRADHFVAGMQLNPNASTKMTLEGFYKAYDNYPFALGDSISLANLGSDFGVIGNEEVNSSSQGRAYGIEFLAQKRSYEGLYGILSYTYVRSEFLSKSGEYISSSWDNRHLLTLTGGVKLKKNWEIGSKFRLIGGRPYTPYDYATSSLIANYDIVNAAVLDYDRLNTERYPFYHQLDVRVDKTWFWNKVSLNLYLDIQNLYGFQSIEMPILLAKTDDLGNRLIDTNDNSRYQMDELQNANGNVLPTIGIIFDF